MKHPDFAARFFKSLHHRLLVAGLLLLCGCELTDEEVLNSRAAFVGSFNMNQTCRGAANSTDRYTLRISQGTGSNTVLLEGLQPFGSRITATVAGNTLTINPQNAAFSGLARQASVSGSGTLTDGSVLEIDFEYDFGGNYNCGARGFKL